MLTAVAPAAATAQSKAPALTARAPDAFYDAPAKLPATPGTLVRSQRVDKATLPAGVQAWRILYTTTIDDKTRGWAVALVFAPRTLPSGPRPVITWAHGTTGLLQKCMPSLVSAPATGIPAARRAIGAGWVIVATDYSFAEKGGPHPYLIGEGEARATLDAVKAARSMPELKLDERTVVWGHSQGGHAALWTGMLGPQYAPAVKIVGVAAIAPAANIVAIMKMNPAADKRLGPYIARAYSRFYPDVTFDQALRAPARKAASQVANLCGFVPVADPQRIAALTSSFEGPSLNADNPAFAARLEQNTAGGMIAAPVVIAQGSTDKVVPPPATNKFVQERCAAGQRVEYWTFEGQDHGSIVQPGSPLEEKLVAWTTARFRNAPAAVLCASNVYPRAQPLTPTVSLPPP